jgi:hypothetical protein
MACLVFLVLANAGHRPDGSHNKERKPSHFQPELMRHPAE